MNNQILLALVLALLVPFLKTGELNLSKVLQVVLLQ